jgi:beta-glucosidase
MKEINELIEQMTIEEKAALCIGASAWTTATVERLGIPAIFVTDGPHGIRKVANEDVMIEQSLPATCFPTASCLAATWNPTLLFEMGEAMAEEAHALDVDVILGPGANIKRSPLGGRNFEYFSEDPQLSGELASGLIDGIQSKGVGTSLKHYAANNQEYQRLTINAVIDERTLREIYLRSFEIAVKKSKPWTVMCAYNKVNGEYCSEHHRLLTEILKEEWGFEGLVVSDWGAVHDRVKSLLAGLDLEMPGPQPRRLQKVVDAVQSGELEMGVLDETVRRILRIVFMAQEVKGNDSFDEKAHHLLARKIAAEGVVLLKNDGILPLKGQERIAVIGNSAKTAYYQGGGSSHINPTEVDIPFNELRKRAEDNEWLFAQGYPEKDEFDQALIDEAVSVAKSAEVAILYIALPASKESEGYDRPDLTLTDQQIALIQAVSKVQPKVVVVLNSGSAVSMQPWFDDVNAILLGWMMGQAGGGAIADVLLGKVNPSGKLAETFPVKLEDTPAFINFPGGAGEVRYGEGLYVGYRYYDAKKMPVQFPFGFGMSYTNFAYGNLQVPEEFTDVEGLTIKLDVTNTGKMAGKETVQVYVHDCRASLDRPPKELKGFAKVDLEPGETKTVTIPLDFHAFAFYHPSYEQWVTEDGDFEILVGASVEDIRLTARAAMTSTLELPCILNEESTIREWLDDPRGKEIIHPLMMQIQSQFQDVLGGEDTAGMDFVGMFMDMPLMGILMFQQDALPMPVEEMVAGMLQKAHAG